MLTDLTISMPPSLMSVNMIAWWHFGMTGTFIKFKLFSLLLNSTSYRGTRKTKLMLLHKVSRDTGICLVYQEVR